MKKIITLICFLLLQINSSAQKVHTILSETYSDGNWNLSSMQTYSYDFDGYPAAYLLQFRDAQTGTWKNYMQDIYTSNASGNIQRKINQFWNNIDSVWYTSSRVSYEFTINGKVLSELSEVPVDTGWLFSLRTTNSYDAAGNLTNSLRQFWDAASASWINSGQDNYVNNPDGTANEKIEQSWDNMAGIWKNSVKLSFTYNGAGKLVSLTETIWEDGNWNNRSRETHSYDAGGNLVNLLTDEWIASSNWLYYNQRNYTNNPNGTINQVVFQSWDEFVNNWNTESRLSYTYLPATAVKDVSAGKLLFPYPNPASDKVFIAGNLNTEIRYEVLDFLGKSLLRGIVSTVNKELDIKSLPPGNYQILLNGISHRLVKNR